MFRYIIIGLMVLFASEVSACRVRARTVEEKIDSSMFVFVGQVTGVQLPTFQNLLMTYVFNKPYTKSNEDDVIEVGGTEIYTVVPRKPFKGSLKGVLTVEAGGCTGDLNLREQALFYVSEYEGRLVASVMSTNSEYFDSEIKEVIKVVGSGR